MRVSEQLRVAARLMAVAALLSGLVAGCAPATPAPSAVRELRVGLPGVGSGEFDPMVLNRNDWLSQLAIYDQPLQLDANGALAPGVVKSWEMSPDGLTWTFRLRDDVYFHEGKNKDGTAEPARKLTSADIKFSYEQLVTTRNQQAPLWTTMLGKTPKIETPDDYTVKIFGDGPQPNIATLSTTYPPGAFVMPKAYIEKNGADWYNKNPIGTGPYKLAKFVPGDRMELEAVAKHWSGVVPDFGRVVVYQIPEETTMKAMLEKGQLDVIPVSLQSAMELKKKGFTIQTGVSGQVQVASNGVYLPDYKSSPLADVRVRQALSLAINRQEIIDNLMGGLGEWPPLPRTGWSNADFTPALREKWMAWSKQNYRYDPAAAKKLLADAGYASGVSFEIWAAPDSSAAFQEDVVLACLNYWKQVGVNATFVAMDQAKAASIRDTSKSKEILGKMNAFSSNTSNPSTVRQMSRFTTVENLLNGSPDWKEMDALYKEGLSTLNPARLEKIIDRILEITTSSWVAFSIVAGPTTYAFGPRVDFKVPASTVMVAQYYHDMKYTGTEPKK